MGEQQAPQHVEEHRKGGLLDRLFGGHYEEEAAPVVQIEQPEMPTGATGTAEAVANAAVTGELTQSVEDDVKSAGTDMVVGGGEAVINLKDAEVHPAEMGEEKFEVDATAGTTEVSIKTEDATSSETDTQEDASETAVPVAVEGPGEFSTAVPPADVKEELPVVIGGEAKADEVGGSEQVASEAAESQDADSSKPQDAAAMLEKFQKELRQEADTSGEANGTGDMPATSVESTDSGSAEAGSGEVSVDSEVKKDAIDPDVLNEQAADEADDIAARFNEMNSRAEAKPEIHAMGGEIPVEAVDEVEGGETTQPENEATTTEQGPAVTPVEDEPFPAPPVEDEADKPQVDAGVASDNEAEAPEAAEGLQDQPEATEIINPDRATVVDGADVHINRAKYLEPDEPTTESEPAQPEGSEVATADVLKLPVAERAALEETAADLEKRAKAIRDLLEKAA